MKKEVGLLTLFAVIAAAVFSLVFGAIVGFSDSQIIDNMIGIIAIAALLVSLHNYFKD